MFEKAIGRCTSGIELRFASLVYVSLDTCCSHFLTIIAGVDLHFRHESELFAEPRN